MTAAQSFQISPNSLDEEWDNYKFLLSYIYIQEEVQVFVLLASNRWSRRGVNVGAAGTPPIRGRELPPAAGCSLLFGTLGPLSGRCRPAGVRDHYTKLGAREPPPPLSSQISQPHVTGCHGNCAGCCDLNGQEFRGEDAEGGRPLTH